ncbi:MAG: hypothetical protein MPJ82_03150 [Alphaproteobacteria bacterium]|nr:hypothetical protein [Alphaproteobacteria bacterium]MDA7988873.1 hypothetical protein [Alphaproteobacteria bacterium]MDA8009347.1 hypothetical protein [Alphaproteobacteria bacterium]
MTESVLERTATLAANPAATMDAGWRPILLRRLIDLDGDFGTGLTEGDSDPAAISASFIVPGDVINKTAGGDDDDNDDDDDNEDGAARFLDSIWGTPPLSRLIFRLEQLAWPRGDPFATAAGRALLLDGDETRLFATYLGLSCHRDWYANLIDGRLSRRMESIYDNDALAFLNESDDNGGPFTVPALMPWRSGEHTLSLGLQLWERMIGDIDREWRARLRLKLPPHLPRDETPPAIADGEWSARLLARLFPRCLWLRF